MTKRRLFRHGRMGMTHDGLLNDVLDRLERPDEPVTEGQIEQLKKFGVDIPAGLNKWAASFAIHAVISYKEMARLSGVPDPRDKTRPILPAQR